MAIHIVQIQRLGYDAYVSPKMSWPLASRSLWSYDPITMTLWLGPQGSRLKDQIYHVVAHLKDL